LNMLHSNRNADKQGGEANARTASATENDCLIANGDFGTATERPKGGGNTEATYSRGQRISEERCAEMSKKNGKETLESSFINRFLPRGEQVSLSEPWEKGGHANKESEHQKLSSVGRSDEPVREGELARHRKQTLEPGKKRGAVPLNKLRFTHLA